MSIVTPQLANRPSSVAPNPDKISHAGTKGSGINDNPGNNITVVTDNHQLRALCRRLQDEDFLAVDTEFMRDHTYWPKLCLVQLAGSKEAAIIDPLCGSNGKSLDFAPFYELMGKSDIVKVFHSARQDIEIFFNTANLIPRPVFDTQVAAMVCGFGESASYATLVHQFLGAVLDKSSRLTDWSRRPLSQRQLTYALDDVVHLRRVYEILARSLEESGRFSWVEEDMARLVDPETYRMDPQNAWKRLKRRVRSRRSFALLIEVAAWRESMAQQRNVPRGRVLKDDCLYEIVSSAPRNREQLEALRAVPRGFSGGRHARSLFAAIAAGEARAKNPESLPRGYPNPRPVALVQANSELVELLKLLLKLQCARHKVASRLVADSNQLEAFAIATNREEAEHALLSGWRREVFGAVALEAKHGRIGVGMKAGQLQPIRINS